MKQIDLATANKIREEYKKSMKDRGHDKEEHGYTHTVSFKTKDLKEWLNSLSNDCDNIKFHFGMYEKKDKYSLSQQTNKGRLTLLLWPYNKEGEHAKDADGDLELPVNAGKLEP